MNKTFTYVLLVIGVYLLVIFPKVVKSTKAEKETETTKEEEKITEKNKNEDGVSQGAGGRLKYSIGYTN